MTFVQVGQRIINIDRVDVITINDASVDARLTSGAVLFFDEEEGRALLEALGIDFETARAIAAEARAKRARVEDKEVFS